MQNGTPILEDSQAVPYKAKCNFTKLPSKSTWRFENLCLHKILHVWLYSWLPKVRYNKEVFQQVEKLWYIYKREYTPEIAWKELSSHPKTWMKPKCKLLSERSLYEKTPYFIFQLNDILQKVQL